MKYIKKLGQLLGFTNVKPVHNLNSSEKKGNEIFEKIQVEGTPFWIVGNEDGYFLVMQNIRLSPKLNTVNEVDQYLKENLTNCIITAILCILDIKTALAKETLNNHEIIK